MESSEILSQQAIAKSYSVERLFVHSLPYFFKDPTFSKIVMSFLRENPKAINHEVVISIMENADEAELLKEINSQLDLELIQPMIILAGISGKLKFGNPSWNQVYKHACCHIKASSDYPRVLAGEILLFKDKRSLDLLNSTFDLNLALLPLNIQYPDFGFLPARAG